MRISRHEDAQILSKTYLYVSLLSYKLWQWFKFMGDLRETGRRLDDKGNEADQLIIPLSFSSSKETKVGLFERWDSKSVKMHDTKSKWSGDYRVLTEVYWHRKVLSIIAIIERPSTNGFTLPSAQEVRDHRVTTLSYENLFGSTWLSSILISILFITTL